MSGAFAELERSRAAATVGLGEDVWRQAFKRCEESLGIVAGPPSFDDVFCLREVLEDVFVQAFITQPAVEAFDKGILHGIAGLDVMPGCPGILTPSQHGVRRHLRAVVGYDQSGRPRRSMKVLSSLVSLAPDSKRSTTAASASRVQSFTKHRMRNR